MSAIVYADSKEMIEGMLERMLQMKALRAHSMAGVRSVCWVFGLSAAITSMLVSGCATNREDLVKSGDVTLQKHRSGKVYIAWCDVYRDENGLLVTGVMRRDDCVGLPIRARVDVRVMSPDGSVVLEARSGDTYVPRRVTGKGQSLKRFTVRLPEIPPRGSLIRLVVTNGVSEHSTQYRTSPGA
jgi:hypothetical protein